MKPEQEERKEEAPSKGEKFWKDLDTAKEELNDRLGQYVLDEDKLHRNVPFQQFLLDQDTLGIGLLLPKWEDVLDKNGNSTGKRRQVTRPVVITSNHHPRMRLLNVQGSAIYEHKIQFLTIPSMLNCGWELSSIKFYLESDSPPPTLDPKGVFIRCRARYEHHLYFSRPEWYAVHALWDMGTYFAQLFHAFPYMELRGVKGAAKTKVMRVSRELTFNAGEIWSNPSEATLFRETHDKRPTIYLDEAETLFRLVKGKPEFDARIEIINSGYSQGSVVPRQEKVGNRYSTVYYHTYCPKMIASINGLYGATESRAIIHVMTRAPRNDTRGEREVDPRDEVWQQIRNDLYAFMISRWKDVLSEYEALQQDNPTSLRQREYQLWRPLLAIARVVGEDVYAQVVTFAQLLADTRTEDVEEGSFDHIVLTRFHELLSQGNGVVLLKDIACDPAFGDKKPHSKTLKRSLDALGFMEGYDRFSDGMGYRISEQMFRSIVETISPSIFHSFPSFATPQRQLIDDTQIVKETMKEKVVKEIDEGNGANEGNEDERKLEGPIALTNRNEELVTKRQALIAVIKKYPGAYRYDAVGPAIRGLADACMRDGDLILDPKGCLRCP